MRTGWFHESFLRGITNLVRDASHPSSLASRAVNWARSDTQSFNWNNSLACRGDWLIVTHFDGFEFLLDNVIYISTLVVRSHYIDYLSYLSYPILPYLIQRLLQHLTLTRLKTTNIKLTRSHRGILWQVIASPLTGWGSTLFNSICWSLSRWSWNIVNTMALYSGSMQYLHQ